MTEILQELMGFWSFGRKFYICFRKHFISAFHLIFILLTQRIHVQDDLIETYSTYSTQEADLRDCSWTGTVGIPRIEVSDHCLVTTALTSG